MAEALSGVVGVRPTGSAEVARERTCCPASTGLSVWPWHDPEGRAGGFEARHSLAVRCASVEEAGDLLSALADAVGDALVVDGVSLDVSDTSDARATAAEAAWDDARAHAAHLAALAGAAAGGRRRHRRGRRRGRRRRRRRPSRPTPTASSSRGRPSVHGAVTVTWTLV